MQRIIISMPLSESMYARFRLATTMLTTYQIAIVSVWTLAFFLSEVFLCGPHPEKRWLGKDRTHCVDENNLNLVYAVTDATFDILIIVMPFPCIRKLKMDRRQQLGVAGIFALVRSRPYPSLFMQNSTLGHEMTCQAIRSLHGLCKGTSLDTR